MRSSSIRRLRARLHAASLVAACALVPCSAAWAQPSGDGGTILLAYDASLPPLRFAAVHVADALRGADPGSNVVMLSDALAESHEHLAPANHESSSGAIIVFATREDATRSGVDAPSLDREGYAIRRALDRVYVVGADATGSMYGMLDVAEQVRMKGGMDGIVEKVSEPRFALRAVKFNLPWSPYRPADPTGTHVSVCRDLTFWERFLDAMAVNRFNALTLWNLHPFPFMIRSRSFPEASPFSDDELAEWKGFWKVLFRMAKDRGIETYLVNWNIVVSPEMAKFYGVSERNDTSGVVRRYMRESVTQVINEYEDLTGLGVTLADWMEGMTPEARETWIEETFVAGMRDADRPVKFIHRSVLAGSPLAMRDLIDAAGLPDPVWVEIKFNWSHGHSTPRLAMTHDHASGEIDDRFWRPVPENYRIAWTIRNEDFFVLRWGEPDFIRAHIEENGREYVGGYFVGSEGYIPAVDLSHTQRAHQTWQYAFEKQWLFYMLWGRLLYDPTTSDDVFEAEFERRYGPGTGGPLLRAYTLASRMPLRLASFHAATWDFTLYSEGFLAPAGSRGLHDEVSPFISILELIEHETLDPTLMSIPAYVRLHRAAVPEGTTTPLALADALERDARAALDALSDVRPRAHEYSGALPCEILDVEAWSGLSLYLAEKLRAGVELETYRWTGQAERQAEAVRHLETAASHWDRVVDATSIHYIPTPHVYTEMYEWASRPRDDLGGLFSWARLRDQVARDIELVREIEPHSR